MTRRARDLMDREYEEPIEQGYGVLDSAFHDPSGNHIRISQPLG